MKFSKKMNSFFEGIYSAFDIYGDFHTKKQDNTLLLAMIIRNRASNRIFHSFSKVSDKLDSKIQLSGMGGLVAPCKKT